MESIVCPVCGWDAPSEGEVCDCGYRSRAVRRVVNAKDDPPTRLHEPARLTHVMIRRVEGFEELYADSSTEQQEGNNNG